MRYNIFKITANNVKKIAQILSKDFTKLSKSKKLLEVFKK